MQKNSFTRFIEGAGGCIVSKRILSGESPVKWMFREKSVNEIDNGWRFFSSMDDDDYVNNVNNLAVCDFNTVANIEPLVLGYYTFPRAGARALPWARCEKSERPHGQPPGCP